MQRHSISQCFDAQAQRDGLAEDLLLCRQQLAELREQHDRHLLEVTAQAKTQQAVAHEELLRERAQLKEQYER
jgi:spindle assembly abnormal protein 6